MRNKPLIVVLCSVALLASATGLADQNKVKPCTICHGIDGYSDNPDHFPHLFGKSATHIAKALREYRSGKRQNKMMEKATRNLSDEDIDFLADYYGNIK